MAPRFSAMLIALLILAGGCQPVEPTPEPFRIDSFPTIEAEKLKANPYPDLFVAAKVSRKEGPAIVLLRVLNNRKILGASRFSSGDSIAAILTPVDETSSALQQIQIWDEMDPIETAGFPRFVAKSPSRLDQPIAFSSLDANPPPETSSSVEPLPLDPAKLQRIADARSRLVERRTDAGYKSWENWQVALEPFRQRIKQGEGLAAHLSPTQLAASLRPHFREAVLSDSPTPVDAIASLSRQFAQRGVDFLYLSLPLRSEIYPEWFGASPDLDTSAARLEFLDLLGAEGVEFLDAGEILRNAKIENREGFRPYWQVRDGHLTPQGHRAIARVLAEYLEERDLLPKGASQTFPESTITISAPKHADMQMTVRQVIVPATSGDSPVFLAGDSNLYFWQTTQQTQAGLPSQLAAETGHLVDWKSIAGMQPHIFGKYAPETYVGKKLVIYLHTAWLLWDERVPMQPVILAP